MHVTCTSEVVRCKFEIIETSVFLNLPLKIERILQCADVNQTAVMKDQKQQSLLCV